MIASDQFCFGGPVQFLSERLSDLFPGAGQYWLWGGRLTVSGLPVHPLIMLMLHLLFTFVLLYIGL